MACEHKHMGLRDFEITHTSCCPSFDANVSYFLSTVGHPSVEYGLSLPYPALLLPVLRNQGACISTCLANTDLGYSSFTPGRIGEPFIKKNDN